MARRTRSLGELELEILKVIWEHQPCTVQEVADIFGRQRGYARTTILTVMQRLHAKRFLQRRKVKGLYRYSPTQERGEVMSHLIGDFLNKVLDGSAAPFVAYLVEKEELTEEQVAALRKIAKELRAKQEGE